MLRVYANLVFDVRLEETDKRTRGAEAIRVLINDVARLITRQKRTDHVRIRDLLDRACVPSLNEVVIKASGMLAWMMTHPSHPLHSIFLESCLQTTTRSASAGLVKVTKARESVAIRNAQRVWNCCSALRSAQTTGAARSAIDKFVRTIPFL